MNEIFRRYDPNGNLIQEIIDGTEQSLSKSMRLGDKIAAIAQPIARAIDFVAGTKVAGCGGCKKMRQELNAGVPFAKALKHRFQKVPENNVKK